MEAKDLIIGIVFIVMELLATLGAIAYIVKGDVSMVTLMIVFAIYFRVKVIDLERRKGKP